MRASVVWTMIGYYVTDTFLDDINKTKSCICFNSVQQIKLTIYSAPSIYKYYQPIQVNCFFQTFVSLAIEVRVVLLENDYFD